MRVRQLPRGNTAINDGFTGNWGSLTVDTERWELRLHGNNKPGGQRILNLDQLLEIFVQIDSEFGNVQFAPEDKGFLTRIDDKTWALRGFQAGQGIVIANQLGTAGNPLIGVDADFVSGIASGLVSRRINHFLTEGTDEAFTIPAALVEGWSFGNGVMFAARFHAAPKDDATLKVGNAAAASLMTLGGSTKISQIIKQNDTVILLLSEGSWWIVGVQIASNIPITPIEGLGEVKNVQEALAALLAKFGEGGGSGGGGSTIDGLIRYGSLSATGAEITHVTHPLAVGESRYIETTARTVGIDVWDTQDVTVSGIILRLATGYFFGQVLSGLAKGAQFGGSGSTALNNQVLAPPYAATDLIRIPSRLWLLGTTTYSIGYPSITSRISAVGVPVEL